LEVRGVCFLELAKLERECQQTTDLTRVNMVSANIKKNEIKGVIWS